MAQIFADIKTPYVNEATLKKELCPQVLRTFSKAFFKTGRGGNREILKRTDAAQIQVIRVKAKHQGCVKSVQTQTVV